MQQQRLQLPLLQLRKNAMPLRCRKEVHLVHMRQELPGECTTNSATTAWLRSSSTTLSQEFQQALLTHSSCRSGQRVRRNRWCKICHGSGKTSQLLRFIRTGRSLSFQSGGEVVCTMIPVFTQRCRRFTLSVTKRFTES